MMADTRMVQAESRPRFITDNGRFLSRLKRGEKYFDCKALWPFAASNAHRCSQGMPWKSPRTSAHELSKTPRRWNTFVIIRLQSHTHLPPSPQFNL